MVSNLQVWALVGAVVSFTLSLFSLYVAWTVERGMDRLAEDLRAHEEYLEENRNLIVKVATNADAALNEQDRRIKRLWGGR